MTLGASSHRKLTMGSTHPSTLDVAEAVQTVSGGPTHSCLNEGESGAPNAELSYMSKPAMGAPIGRRSTRHLRMIGRCRPSQPEQHLARGI